MRTDKHQDGYVQPGNPTQGPNAVDIPINLNLTFVRILVFDGRPSLGLTQTLPALTMLYLTIKNRTTQTFFINGYNYTSPPIPVLLQILNGNVDPFKLLPLGSVIGLKRNSTVQITLPPPDDGIPHPFHLHGVRDFSNAVSGLPCF